MQEQDDNMTEIANAIFSDLLTENPEQAISTLGPNRIVPDRYKGMSPEQIEAIRKKQLEQIEERKVYIFFYFEKKCIYSLYLLFSVLMNKTD